MGQNQTYNIKFDNHHLDLSFFSETELCQGTTLDATLGGGEGLARLCGLRPVQKGMKPTLFSKAVPSACSCFLFFFETIFNRHFPE